MAVLTVTGTPVAGTKYTVTTASSADWASVSNSTYFFDLTDKLVHYKDSTGAIIELFGAAGGLTYFTEAQSTASPNATVNVDSLTAVSATTNADMALLPKGTGAFIVGHIPDNTYINGGKRGNYAIDIQPDNLNYASGANGANSIAIGTQNNASVGYAVSIGTGGIASGVGSLWLGQNSGGVGVASGANSVAIQLQSRATNTNSFAIQGGLASGSGALAGSNSTASGINSLALAGTAYEGAQATQSNSVAIGKGVISNAPYSIALGAWSSAKTTSARLSVGSYLDNETPIAGYSQLSLISSIARTTTNTVAEFSTWASLNTIALVLQDNEAIRVRGSIIGKQSASTNVACYDFDCIVVRGVGTVTTILPLSNMNLVLDTITLGTIPTLTANTTSGGLSIKSGAKTTTSIRWSCRVDSTEVILS
jgi:hypothetical protein